MQISELMLKTVKTVHKDAVIIVKVGNFYNVYGQDAYIISYLFGYNGTTNNNNSNGVRAVASKKLWLHLLRWCNRRFRTRNKSMSFNQ